MDAKNQEPFTFKDFLSIVLYIGAVVLVTMFIVHFIGQRTVVSGSSMYDTLEDGQNLIVDKISYRFSDPERFDIVVFSYENEDNTYFIKRIIGLPGESVYIDTEGNIYIDGELLEEDYGFEQILDPGLAGNTITLSEDEYFVLGDNRNNSFDSRYEEVGPIPREDIIGKVWIRIFPFDLFGKVD